MQTTVEYYLKFYQLFFMRWWNGMGPMEYAAVLTAIAFFGWLLMKNGVR